MNVAVNHIGECSELELPDWVSTRVVFGIGAAERVSPFVEEVLARRGGQRLLLLTGTHSSPRPWIAGFLHELRRFHPIALAVRGASVESVSGVMHRLSGRPIDVIVARGGGAVIDTAKAVALLMKGRMSLADALAAPQESAAGVPLVCIPTTAGSSADVTHFATIWDPVRKRKHSLEGRLAPLLSIVDPVATMTQPPWLAASSGLDVIAHGIEAAVAVRATPQSIECAIQAIERSIETLPRVRAHPADIGARREMSLASVLAGTAIAKSRTTLSHAVSYPLTIHYGVHHGHACGLTVGGLVELNQEVQTHNCRDPRGVAHTRGVVRRICAALGVGDGAEARAKLDRVIEKIGLARFGCFPHFDCGLIAAEAISYGRSENNPRAVSQPELQQWLRSLAAGDVAHARPAPPLSPPAR